MKHFITLCVALSMACVFTVGCEKKAEVKKVETTSTPDGTTTVTDSKKVETTGDAPPAADAK